MHVFRRIVIGDKGDDAAVLPGDEVKACLLFYFSEETFLRALSFLKFSADADPLVFIEVVLFFCAVEQKIAAVTLDIAQGGIDHHGLLLLFGSFLFPSLFSFRCCGIAASPDHS